MHKYIEPLEDTLTTLLLSKYHNIIGKKFKKGTSSEQIVEHIINYYQDIISCMPGNVYWLDKNCIGVGCNHNVLAMFGLNSISDFKGLTFEEMRKIGNWSQKATKSFKNDTLSVIHSGQAKLNIEEPPIPHADGRIIYFLTSRVPLFDHTGSVVGVVGISIDITYRKEMEMKLKAAKEQAEEASRAKTIFLANMSHDLKTPLMGMISTAEYLSHSLSNFEDRARANDIVQSGLCLLDFMTDVIKISSFEIKDPANEQLRFNMKKIIDDIVLLVKPAIANKSIHFDLNYDNKIPHFLIGNRWYLYRILLNLISNAIKFTQKGKISLGVHMAKRTSKNVILKIEVKDTGMGIPKDKQEIIFDPFTRLLPSHEGVYSGTGLGLSIVKQFIKAIHGEIYVESELNQGSTFTLVIPLKKSLIQDDSLPEKEKPLFVRESATFNQIDLPNASLEKRANHFENFPNIKVLIVEDNKIAAQSAIATLLSFGVHQVDLARSGKEALSLFENAKYDLIYMDLGLPDMGGIEVTKKIREMEKKSGQKVVILALSAHVDKELQLECSAAGMNNVFSKPLLRELAKKTLLDYVS